MDVEINNRNADKFIPHPVLDDPNKMMRIIANPVYDKLTLSRAAYIRKTNSFKLPHKSVRVTSPKEKTLLTPLKALNSEPTSSTPLPILNNQSQLKSSSSSFKRQNAPSFPLLTPSPNTRISPRNSKLSNRSRNNSIHSSLLEHDKKPVTDSTIRYVNSRHGFEVQRYSSSNWLSIDLLTKDACESEEKTFREMLDKKEQTELLSRSIYTSEYYRQRWDDLLQSYKDGHLTHDQWAKQNYQLYCLKTFYTQALEREQYLIDLHAQNQRQRRAQHVFNQWKESKNDGNNSERHRSHLNTATSQRTTDVASVLSNTSSSPPPAHHHHHNHTVNRISISSIAENDLEELPLFRPMHLSKNMGILSKSSYMLDEQRWSLKAMLKRVVGLAEPLPPPPKILNRQHSALTNLSNDSGFESGP